MTFDNSDGFFNLLPDTAPKRKSKPSDNRSLERDIQKAIIKALRKRDIFVCRVNAGKINIKDGADPTDKGRYIVGATAGHSDLYGVLAPHGRAWFIEVKRPGEKPTVLQSQFLKARAAEGALVGVADSVVSALALFGFEPTRWEVGK